MNLQQNTKEWENFRRMKIGASDAPSIMGVGFLTPYKLWRVKLGFEEVEKNWAMKKGKELEPIARDAFIKETEIFVTPKVVQHKELEWMIASLDGISFDEKTIVEIKCAGKDDHSKALSGMVPEKYYPQLQHQMYVVGLQSMYYYSFHNNEGCVVKVERDDKYIDRLLEKEVEFLNCMLDFSPPDMIDKDVAVSYKKRDDADWTDLVINYKDCIERKKQIEKEESYLKNLLIKSANGENCVGNGLKLEKIIRKGSVDYSSIPELNGVDIEKYRKKHTTYWKVGFLD